MVTPTNSCRFPTGRLGLAWLIHCIWAWSSLETGTTQLGLSFFQGDAAREREGKLWGFQKRERGNRGERRIRCPTQVLVGILLFNCVASFKVGPGDLLELL